MEAIWSSAKIPQRLAFLDHCGIATYSHLQEFGGVGEKSLCFLFAMSVAYFQLPRAVIHSSVER
jgi:hypothetical protein